ncbi:MAG: hypothetical protein HYX68_11830 [Planctomycetes bacterium]|nr:hypothetical protein [Planctomycetota bacterium]
MAVKINKDALLKNRFWIMLGVTVAVTLFGLVYLQLVNAETEKKGPKGALGSAKPLKEFTGPLQIDQRTKDAERAKAKESTVWAYAYKTQAPLFRWAKAVEDQFPFFDGNFANEITVTKASGKEKDSWPADTDELVHGILTSIERDSLKLETRKAKEFKLFRTKTVDQKIILEGETKELGWLAKEGLPKHRGKVLAVRFQVGKFFNDPLRDVEQAVFAESYKEQIHTILRSVEPLNEKGQGIVQLRNWLYRPDTLPEEKFIRYVQKEWDTRSNFSDEAWIAQEDIWIQQEIYRIIRSVNDEVKVLRRVEGDAKGKKRSPEDRGVAQVFRNTNFEMILSLDGKDNLSVTLKNLLPRGQRLDVSFLVTMNLDVGQDPELITISGLPLLPAGAAGGKDSIVSNIPYSNKSARRKGVYKVEQVIGWEGAAIKRIDQITIGSNGAGELSHSHRTFPEGLRPLVLAPDAKDGDKDKQSGGPPGPGGGLKVGSGGFGPGGGGQGGGATGNKKMLAHGLWTHRYASVTPQSRRIPVAVSVIVDQDHVDRVLTAFNNSKLRFLETQVLLNQYIGSLQPPISERKNDDGPSKQGSGSKGGVFDPMGAKGSSGGGQGSGGAGADRQANMEMVIYGIMTLYQRYPPRPETQKKE